MLNAIYVVLKVISLIWVYRDATKNGIGKIPGVRGMSVGRWAIGTALMWIVVFPAYLIKRNRLIAAAKQFPIEVEDRPFKMFSLVVAGGVWLLVAFSAAANTGLPTCSNSAATQIVGKLITELPAVKSTGVQYLSLKDISE